MKPVLIILSEWLLNNNILTDFEVLAYMQIHSNVAQIMCKNTHYLHLYETQRVIKDKLKYDDNVYDENTYNRVLLKKQFASIIPEYNQLKIPYINSCYDDFADENEKVYYIDEHEMFTEFKLFIEEYKKNPSVLFKVCYPAYISSILNLNKQLLTEYFCLPDKDRHGKFIFLIPLIYATYHKVHNQGSPITHILCYVNIPDEDPKILYELPAKTNRFIRIDVEIDDARRSFHDDLKKILKDIYLSVTDTGKKIMAYYYPGDIFRDCLPFAQVLDKL